MSVAVLSLKVKSMIYVDRMQNAQNYFVLEDTRPAQRLQDGGLSFSITCGLNDSFAIATRYVADKNIALPLVGNEAQCKNAFERKKGLTRATSVYYRINECRAFARLNITVDSNDVRRVRSSYLTVYALPKGLSSQGTLDCKQITLNPGYINRITQLMLVSLWSRSIIS